MPLSKHTLTAADTQEVSVSNGGPITVCLSIQVQAATVSRQTSILLNRVGKCRSLLASLGLACLPSTLGNVKTAQDSYSGASLTVKYEWQTC